MNGMQPPSPCNKWSQLSRVLPAEQREQLAAILLARLKVGWGIVEIEIKGGHLKEFRNVDTIPAVRPPNNAVIEPKTSI